RDHAPPPPAGLAERRAQRTPTRGRGLRTPRSASEASASARPDGPAARRAHSPVPVLDFLVLEVPEARREVVMHPVRLAEEVEIADLRRMGGSLHRGEAWVADRRRRQTEELPRVVRVVALELRHPQRF